MASFRATVKRTYNTADDFGDLDTLHALVGLTGEIGELADAVKRNQFYGLELDTDNVVEEIGDILYYLSALMLCFDISFDEVVIANQSKLERRYPDGFTRKDSILRRDKTNK